ncbi:hypothetical protein ACFL59_00090 [Planctomycetota bacterium]
MDPRLKRTVLVFLASFACFALGFNALSTYCGRHIPVLRVSASGSAETSGHHPPSNVIDCSTVETYTLDNFWLLPDSKPGWIKLDFEGEHEVHEIGLLNTRNGLRKDRYTEGYSLSLIAADGTLRRFRGVLGHYPTWTRYTFDRPEERPRAVSAVIEVVTAAERGGGLNEAVFRGVPVDRLSRTLAMALPLLLSLIAASLVALLYRVLRSLMTPQNVTMAGLTFLLVAVGVNLLRYSTSLSVFEWDLVFDVRELTSWGSVFEFFRNLMVPIPPALAMFEIAAYNLTGSIDASIRHLYKISLLTPYVLVLFLAYPSIPRMVLSFLVSLVFLWSTVIIHPGNPQIYDAVFPMLVMLFICFQHSVGDLAEGERPRTWVLLLSGFSLAMVTLVRPFMILLLGPILLLVYLQLRGRCSRQQLLWFLAPVLLFAVLWHVHLFASHGQLTFSNHSGFNMVRAWPGIEAPALLDEEVRPPYRGKNNPTHIRNSQRLTRAVLGHIALNPVQSGFHVLKKVDVTLSGKTAIDEDRLNPQHYILGTYRLLVKITGALMIAALLVIVGESCRLLLFARDRLARFISRPQHVLVFIVTSSLLITSAGESGEEARFLIAVLPMLAALPIIDLVRVKRG